MEINKNSHWVAELLRAEANTMAHEVKQLNKEMEKYFLGDIEYKELYKQVKSLTDQIELKEKMIARLISCPYCGK